MNSQSTHIQRAIDLHGSQAGLARAMGCSQQLISQLLRGGTITAEMAVRIDRATGGQVAKQFLRPDLFEAQPDSRPGGHEDAA